MAQPFIRANVTVSLDELNKAIDRVSKATGKSLDEVVKLSGIMFARGAGKAMPPSGKWGHPAKARNRVVFEKHAGTYFNQELGDPAAIEGKRKKGQDMMYALSFKRGREKYTRHFWKKSDANKHRKILTRGIAKAQFWRALELQGVSKPRSAFVAPSAEIQADKNVSVKRGRGFLMPFIDIASRIQTASGYRPYAMVRGLNDAKRQVRSWAKRLEQEQRRAWR